MPPRRLKAAELARLLDSAARPVYVLDEDLTIVFLNRACQDWLGPAAEGSLLLGQRCAYHSEPNDAGPKAVAAGLCPPPRVLSGEIAEAAVCRSAEGEKFAERMARFIPLGGDKDELIAIVAVLDAEDRPPEGVEEKKGTVPICRNGPQGASHKWGLSPFSPDDGLAAEAGATQLHEHIRRFRNEAAARYRTDRLIGSGPAMRLARRQVELSAACRSSVLLVGPQGSGRRRLAAAIHYGKKKGDSPHLCDDQRCASVPASGPFRQMGTVPFFPGAVAEGTLATLDCSLLGAEALEAMAAAAARTAARDLRVTPETLLLHRVDELPADVQVQVAEFLSGRTPTWRLAATAAEPLVELSRRGKFHADLAALLSTITIELPPLVQRREDIPLLAQLFLEERNAAGSRQIGGFTPSALDRLDAYHWPGNLDELSEVVAEAHGRAAGREIGPQDLPERLRLAAQAAAQPPRVEETIVLDEFLGRVERELIRRAVARAKGNKARAARLLGVTRPRLYRRMVQLGLE